MADKNPHAEHRKRMRMRFIEQGLDGFEQHQILELLLFYAIPQKDTNPMAHDLLDKFGALTGVLESDPKELMTVNGIGEYAAGFLHLISQVAARYMDLKIQESTRNKPLNTTQKLVEYLQPKLLTKTREETYLLCLDNRMCALNCQQIGTGDVSSTSFSPRDIVKLANQYKAPAVVLAHNHPRGFATPSRQDLEVTRQLQSALRLMKIELIDHLIFAQGVYTSLRESGVLMD